MYFYSYCFLSCYFEASAEVVVTVCYFLRFQINLLDVIIRMHFSPKLMIFVLRAVLIMTFIEDLLHTR